MLRAQPCPFAARAWRRERVSCATLSLQGDIAKLGDVYDGFLAEYPLCFGYWKKYADAQLRLASPEAAAAVYERGVAAVPYSVDFWAHYAAFRQSNGASAEDVRRSACVLAVTLALWSEQRKRGVSIWVQSWVGRW